MRASFGPVGANIPALLRAIVACGWFGIQSWLGGQAIAAMVGVLAPQTTHMPWVLWTCFLGFWLLNMAVVWNGVESIRFLQSFSAPFMLLMSLILLFWMLHKAGGFGPMLSAPSRFTSTSSFMHFFIPSLTAMVGYWATLSLNIPDFTRYAKNQDAQIIGQAFGLPVAMVLYSFIASPSLRRQKSSSASPSGAPSHSLGRFHQPFVAFLGLIALLVATFKRQHRPPTSSRHRTISPTSPRDLSAFRTGGMITGFLGLAMMPWKLMETFGSYIFGWLVGYSGLLGPVAGIMVADYFLVRGTKLDTYSLYRRGGIYEYRRGVSPAAALIALVIGVVAALIGRFVPAVAFLYDYAWFVGFFLSGALYYLMMLGHSAMPAIATERNEATQ